MTLTQGFWLGRTEVTQSQYKAVTGKAPSRFQETGNLAPVEEVSWLDAMEFCQLLTARERAGGRKQSQKSRKEIYALCAF